MFIPIKFGVEEFNVPGAVFTNCGVLCANNLLLKEISPITSRVRCGELVPIPILPDAIISWAEYEIAVETPT